MWAKSWTVETVGSSSCSNCITAHVHFSRHRNHHQPIIAYMMLDKRTLYVLLYQIIYYVLRSSFNVMRCYESWSYTADMSKKCYLVTHCTVKCSLFLPASYSGLVPSVWFACHLCIVNLDMGMAWKWGYILTKHYSWAFPWYMLLFLGSYWAAVTHESLVYIVDKWIVKLNILWSDQGCEALRIQTALSCGKAKQ